jgi:hypothetical protein
MFQVHADSLASYLSFDPDRRKDLQNLDALIRAAAPDLRRYFHQGTPAGQPGMRMKMIGYGKFKYANPSGKSTSWPVIGVALQRHYISVYVSVTQNDTPIVRPYQGLLGESRMGRNNFSFERFEDLHTANLFELCRDIAQVFREDPQNAVTYSGARRAPRTRRHPGRAP